MEDYIRQRTKSELKKLFTRLNEKGISDTMMSVLIDLCYNEKPNMRTSGFDVPADPDAVISFDPQTLEFTISPHDPEVEGFAPRFGIYSWAEKPVYHRIFETQIVTLPGTEGPYLIYFDIDTETRLPKLLALHNPTEDEIREVYLTKTIVSWLYWNADDNEVTHFGDDRHGSEWNPKMQLYLHDAFGARRKSGLYIENIVVNADGSSNAHAQFNISSGVILHDDFDIEIPASGPGMPILYFPGGLPRFLENAGYSVWKGTSLLGYNSGMNTLQQCTEGYFVMYHYFATNEIASQDRKMIAVMGINEYENLGAAFQNTDSELVQIKAKMPQQGKCYLGSIIFQTSGTFNNDIKARIVGVAGNEKFHPPVSIATGSSETLHINDKQVLSFNPHKIVNQPLHGFIQGQAVRHNGSAYLLAMANNAENAQTCGIVSRTIDENNFELAVDGYLPGPFIPGAEYFLSPSTAGLVALEPPSYNIGEVRQSLGWGTPHGLKIEIDIGDEIASIADVTEDIYLDSVSIDASAKVTLTRTVKKPDLELQLGTMALKNFWLGTLAEYDAITVKDNNVIYHIEE